jgi:hypothetical protein
VALVIGIGDYQDPLLGKRSDPKADATQISQTPKRLGFEDHHRTRHDTFDRPRSLCKPAARNPSDALII